MTAPMPQTVERWVYTVDQFCEMMQHSRDTFEKLVRRGELAAFKNGRRTYVAKAEAERWLRETQVRNRVGNSSANIVGTDTSDVGTDNAPPDLPTGFGNGAQQTRAAWGGKRSGKTPDLKRTYQK